MSEEQVRSRRPGVYLPLMIAWGLSPALILALAGLAMKARVTDDLSGLLLAIGILGGPIALLIWSVWLVQRMDIGIVPKILLSIGLTFGACFANLCLGFGACALIDPPFNVH